MRHLGSCILLALVALGSVLPLAASCGGNSGSGSGGAGGSGATNSSSGPMCSGTQTACGATCVDTSADTKNCGVCGNDCGASPCCAGACVETASCAFSVSAAEPNVGWLNGGDYLTIKGAGLAPGMRVYIGDARAAVRVIDSTSARIKTPPGPLGPTDLKITQGGMSATLKGGFQYQEAGLATPWQQKPMQKVRGEDPGVAVMQDGRVLVAGGTAVPDSIADGLNTAEIYTRETDVVTPAKNTMGTPRWQNSAITLLDGKVLIVGGACLDDLTMCNGDPKLADLFDPQTDTFTPTKSPMNLARAYTRAVLLPDGRVLIASANDPSLEVYDPDLGTFTQIAHNQLHIFGFMTLLRDGRALLGGGDGGIKAVEVFDPDTNTLMPVGSLNEARSMLTVHTLPDGRAVVIGGSNFSAGGIQDPLDTMEAFDPKTGMFTTLPYKLSIGRTWHASALVRDGTILVMGGYTISQKCDSLSATVDQVDPTAGTVMPFAVLPNANTEWVAVTLLDGSVLGVGGGACGTSMALPDIDFLPGAKGPN